MKHVYHVYYSGDTDVGIPPTEATITFEDNLAGAHEGNDIEFVTKMLAELYDVPETSVEVGKTEEME